MSIVQLRKILDGNEAYPPSEDLWLQIVGLAKMSREDGKIKTIQQRMKREVEIYKPNLPEPVLSRLFFKGIYYYLDGKNNLYKPDGGNPLVGNHVGQIRKNIENDCFEVVIDGEVHHTIENKTATEQVIHEKHYYVDLENKVFRGLHPQLNFIYQIGSLNKHNKIELC